jgi:plasmid stabilization system protein ParE
MRKPQSLLAENSQPPLPIEWSPRAIRDLEGIHAYICLFAPQAAQRFTSRLISAVESLAAQPDRGRLAGRLRELVAVSPYVIRYRVTRRGVEIARIKHGAQRQE